jgi:hypothetical protein
LTLVGSAQPVAPIVHHSLSVLLREGTPLRQLEDIQDRLGWTAQPRSPGRHNDRTVDGDWMGKDVIEQLLVRPVLTAKPELRKWSSLLPQEFARTHPHAVQQVVKRRAARRRH